MCKLKIISARLSNPSKIFSKYKGSVWKKVKTSRKLTIPEDNSSFRILAMNGFKKPGTSLWHLMKSSYSSNFALFISKFVDLVMFRAGLKEIRNQGICP